MKMVKDWRVLISEMKNKKYIFVTLILITVFTLILAIWLFNKNRIDMSLTSPEEKIQVNIFKNKDDQLQYSISMNDKEVILPSDLGVDIEGIGDIGHGASLIEYDIEEVNEEYLNHGNTNVEHNHHNHLKLKLKKNNYEYFLHWKIWDNGIAFKYEYPNTQNKSINEENSTFKFDPETLAWYQMNNNTMQDIYNSKKVKDLNGNEIMTALSTFELPDNQGYVSLSEANLKDYAGIAYRVTDEKSLKAHFWNERNGFDTNSKESPWRIAVISDDLNGLVNNNIAENVSDPPNRKLSKYDWIEPGKATWFHAVDDSGNLNEEDGKEVLENASELGIKYMVIGNDWINWGETLDDSLLKVEQIVNMANHYDIGIFIGKDVPGLEYNLYEKDTRDKFLKKVKETGISGVKFGHIEQEHAEAVNIYHELLQTSMDLELLAIFHNSNKPTGLSRTYPNLLSQEAVRGMQYNLSTNNTNIIPYTRLISGGADFTPINFTDPVRLGDGTWTHMLANTVIIQSNLLTFMDSPNTIMKNDGAEFVKNVPAIWDETIVLPESGIGKLSVFAKRKGDDWFLAVQNSSDNKESLNLRLDFLDEDIEYSSLEYSDIKNENNKYEINEEKRNNSSEISISLNEGGGFVAHFKAK